MNFKKITIIGCLIAGISSSLFASESEVATTFDSATLGACYGCHGISLEKVALGKSKVVANMSEKEINDSLVGYKNGTYGGPMKGIMTAQVKKYSDEDIAAMAKFLKEIPAK